MKVGDSEGNRNCSSDDGDVVSPKYEGINDGF
jgi:hypothetical protein